MRLLRTAVSLARRLPVLIAGLALGVVSLGASFVVPSLHPQNEPMSLSGIVMCSAELALVLIGGGVLDLLVRVVPQYRREIEQDRRLQSGLCLNCGYDLRGSRERCPECGMEFRWRGPRSPGSA